MAWLTALLTPGLILGNAVLWVALNNRVHGRRWPRPLVRALDGVQLLGLFGLPWLWLRWCALAVWGLGPRLSATTGLLPPTGAGATNSPAPALAGWVWLLVGALHGIAGLAIVAWWRRRRAPPPPVVAHQHSTHLDLGTGPSAIPRAPLLRQPAHWIPGSEWRQLEVTHLRLTLPRCPPAWSGLKLVQFSDTHFAGHVPRDYFEQVLALAAREQPDLCLFTGDLLDHPDRVDWLPATFGPLRGSLGNFYILGNHDRSSGNVAGTRAELARLGWQDCTGRCRLVEHRGHTLAIGGNEQPWLGPVPDWSGAPAQAFRLLLAHTPDHLAAARRDEVDLMLSGHTHGGQVCLPVVGPVFSPSRHGVRHAGGTFWEAPTLLHVNRGLSGHSSWRWNCPPQLTILELHPGT